MKMTQTDVRFFLRKRYFVVFLLFLGYIVMHLLRSNLAICIVDMTSNHTVVVGNETTIEPPDFEWNSFEKGIILSAYSWGYTACLVGSVLSLKFGGANVYGAGIIVTAILTTVSPILLRWNMVSFIVGRVLEGVFESFVFPSSMDTLFHWTPPSERARLSSAAYMGLQLGVAVSFPVCGYIAFNYGWEAVFYVTGGVSILWYMLWVTFVRNTPTEDKLMSEKEKKYLVEVKENEQMDKVTVYPWKSILTSRAVWVYINDRFVESWSYSFVLYCLPLFIKDAYNSNIQDVGLLSGVPHVLGMVGLAIAAILADHLRKNTDKIMSITNIHKAYIGFTQLTTVILLLTAGMTENFFLCIVCICLYKFCSSFEFMTNFILPMDIGGPYSSVLMGLGSTGLIIGGILNPIVVGLIVQNHSMSEWNKYFIMLCGINVWGGIIFLLFGSGELQPWASQTQTAK